MPIIKPEGLIGGDRIAGLSDIARLYWPFIYCASNGYGRFKIDYLSIIQGAFKNFNQKPAEEVIAGILKEYIEQSLLFIYTARGEAWGAWDSVAGQRYFNAEDRRSPAPPEPAFGEWRESYRKKKAEQKVSGIGSLAQTLIDSAQGVRGVCVENDGFQREKESISTQTIINTTPTSASTPKTPNNTNTSISFAEGGAGGNQFEGSSPVGSEGWDKLCQLAAKARMSFDPSPFSDFSAKVWRWYSMEEKLLRIEGIEKRIECGQYGPEVDPQYVPTLENFCRKRVYESIRPRAPQLQVVGRKPDVVAEARALAKAQAEKRRAS